MIHTISIGAKISKITYDDLIKKLRQYEKDNKQNTFYYYSNDGIRELSLFKCKLYKQYAQYFITMIINPRVITEQANSYLVSSKRHIDDLPVAFDNLLYRKFPGICLPPFQHWNCKRIDYAVDIHTDYVEEYIKLFNKADSPHWFDDQHKDGSLYRMSKSVTVNFYDKADQLIKLYNEQTTEMVPSFPDNILRIEIQCKYSKTSYIKRKLNFQDKSILNYLDEELSAEMILSYYDKVIGGGDYYNFIQAEKIINDSDEKVRMKNALIKTLKVIANARSISKAREQFQKGLTIKNTTIFVKGSKDTFNKHLRLLRSMGINPVTIPREWALNTLPNMRDQIIRELSCGCNLTN